MSPSAATAKTQDSTQKQITACNFRSAGSISNQEARALTAIHEGFARNLNIALDAFLGTGMEVKLSDLNQMPLDKHLGLMPALTCIVPLSRESSPDVIFLEWDIELIFLMIDLLLGGEGDPISGPRDLSEIEEEIVSDTSALVAHHVESAWRLPAGGLNVGKRIKPPEFDQFYPINEKVTCIKFTLEIGQNTGSIQLVISSALLNMLLQQIKVDQPQKRAAVRYFPKQGIRDRILDSDVEVAVELTSLKVAVKDLLSLLPGSVLKLRASVRTPGMLVAGGHGIFEATPVRNGSRKAAQLGRRIASTNLERA